MDAPAFNLNQAVAIKRNNVPGFVKALHFDRHGWQFRVEYVDDNNAVHDRYFEGDEILAFEEAAKN